MTQASLSPDLQGALGASSANDDAVRRGTPSEASLWMVALTSTGLLFVALLLLGLLVQNVVRDASVGGFVSGVGIVIAMLGIGGVSYALVTARRAGYLTVPPLPATPAPIAPAGMHVVPALPADLGRRRRRELEEERAVRSRQAKAIASASAVATRTERPLPPRSSAPQPTTSTNGTTRPPQRQVARPAEVRAARPSPPPPFQARVAPTASVGASRAKPQAPARPAVTMPRPQVRPARPAAWPARGPVVRMPTAQVRPRTQIATFQVHAANVRPVTPARLR